MSEDAKRYPRKRESSPCPEVCLSVYPLRRMQHACAKSVGALTGLRSENAASQPFAGRDYWRRNYRLQRRVPSDKIRLAGRCPAREGTAYLRNDMARRRARDATPCHAHFDRTVPIRSAAFKYPQGRDRAGYRLSPHRQPSDRPFARTSDRDFADSVARQNLRRRGSYAFASRSKRAVSLARRIQDRGRRVHPRRRTN